MAYLTTLVGAWIAVDVAHRVIRRLRFLIWKHHWIQAWKCTFSLTKDYYELHKEMDEIWQAMRMSGDYSYDDVTREMVMRFTNAQAQKLLA